jgi:hypothetical protein
MIKKNGCEKNQTHVACNQKITSPAQAAVVLEFSKETVYIERCVTRMGV